VLCNVSEQAAVSSFLTLLGALLHDEFGQGENEEEDEDTDNDPVQRALRGDSPDAPQLLVSLGLNTNKLRKQQDSKRRGGASGPVKSKTQASMELKGILCKLECIILQAIVWGLGGALDSKGRRIFD